MSFTGILLVLLSAGAMNVYNYNLGPYAVIAN